MSVVTGTIKTRIPARLDRLPWSSWHWLVVWALGTVWVLDGLEVTIKGAVGPDLTKALGFSTVQVAGSASVYVFGAISGSLIWAYLTDRFGRKKLFMITLATYMSGVILTSLTGLFFHGHAGNYYWFAMARFITGFGVGGEYTAVNSAIDELIPARVRGWVDLVINGSWWIGTMLASSLAVAYLHLLPTDVGWRVAFGTGFVIAFGILLLRFYVPESPRWLITHGFEEEADRIVDDIEQKVADATGESLDEVPEEEELELRTRRTVGFVTIGRTLFKLYPDRTFVAFMLMVTQAFLYNAIFFTYGLMLTTFYGVNPANVGLFLIPFAVGNWTGPIVLGRYFDTIGRRPMIAGTYISSGVGVLIIGWLFQGTSILSVTWITLAWVIIFFIASPAASAGYLTASETFPLEIRAMAIAFIYSTSTAIGGILGPIIYGNLIATHSRTAMFHGYLIGGGLMVLGGLTHALMGVRAEQRSLESIAKPLTVEEADDGGGGVELEGPLGINPVDVEAIRRFQEENDLTVDGVIGEQTRGAILAILASEPDEPEPQENRIGVDVTDADSVRAFQRTHGLKEDGIVGPRTQGAMAAEATERELDVADPGRVRSFQRTHGLPETGIVDHGTQVVLRAVRADREDGDGRPPAGADVTEADSIERFQRTHGLPPDRVIGPRTQGALRAAMEDATRRLLDPTDAGSIRAFQRGHGLEETGEIDAPTQEALRAARQATPMSDEEAREVVGVDPTDPESIRRFQRDHGLEPDGMIGAATREALQRELERTLDVDPADPDSVRRFQREHGLREDGVIGPETQGAMEALRQELRKTHGHDGDDGDTPEAERPLDLDPADPESVKEFQRTHGLEPDGVVGPDTQRAIRGVLLERGEGEVERYRRRRRERREQRRTRPLRRSISARSGLPAVFSLPDEDVDLDREIEVLERALDAGGPATRAELRTRVGASYWGPGRFRRALQTAQREGVVERRRDGRFDTTS